MAGPKEFPFDINPMYEGERIRGGDMYVELGGPQRDGFELVVAADPKADDRPKPDEVEDGIITLIGPDIPDMKEGERYPFAMLYRIAGPLVDKDIEGIVERRNHDFQNYIQGYMHLNQRYDIWIRIHKDAVKKGLKSLKDVARATMMLYKAELPFIEKMDATYITDEAEVKKRLPEAMAIYEWRNARTRSLHEEDVDTFYGCTLCQGFAPSNVCVITPDRVSLCGAISWFDGRAAARVDPEGPQFAIPKGDLLDAGTGEYSGVNEKAVELSGGEVSRIKLHSFMDYPHTSCGCFEVVGFFMPEVDAFGFVNRDFRGQAPNGLPFSTMAGQTGGGKQTLGFLGIGIEYFRSPKFIMADGGWARVAWLPSELKERVKDGIPAELKEKIATEKDVSDLAELKQFLQAGQHPVVGRWAAAAKPADARPAAKAAAPAQPAAMPVAQPVYPPAFAPGAVALAANPGGGVKLVLKDCKIRIEKVIVKKSEE